MLIKLLLFNKHYLICFDNLVGIFKAYISVFEVILYAYLLYVHKVKNDLIIIITKTS